MRNTDPKPGQATTTTPNGQGATPPCILGGPCLDVIRFPDAEHDLLDHDELGLTGIFEPRTIFANGMLDDIERFAARPHDC